MAIHKDPKARVTKYSPKVTLVQIFGCTKSGRATQQLSTDTEFSYSFSGDADIAAWLPTRCQGQICNLAGLALPSLALTHHSAQNSDGSSRVFQCCFAQKKPSHNQMCALGESIQVRQAQSSLETGPCDISQ